MNRSRLLLSGLLLGTLFAPTIRAVYAPIPEEEQGQPLTWYLDGGMYHDSNIFAARTGAISSYVEEIAPSAKFNASVAPQTFVSAGYKLTADYMDSRPGTKALFSHDLSARVAEQFNPNCTLDVHDLFQIEENPASLLAGLPVNTNQSYRRNELAGDLTTIFNDRCSLIYKASTVNYGYDDEILADSLDRDETVLGLEGDYNLQPTWKLLAEYRFQTIDYTTDPDDKNKVSHFYIVGTTYTASPQLSYTGRVGIEDRLRSEESAVTAPYAELSAKYGYGPQSFVSGGYTYSLQETDNVVLYNDEKVNALFVNVQQLLGGSLVGSTSIDFEPSQLQGRDGISPNRDENTTRCGVALTWMGAKNWSVSATFDYDRVSSQDATRDYIRDRIGITAHLVF